MTLPRFLMNSTTRRMALKGVVGATAVASSLRSHLSFAQDTSTTPGSGDDVKPATLSGPQTLLVGGIDFRGKGEPENSDVLMLVRVDLIQKTLRVLSIS